MKMQSDLEQEGKNGLEYESVSQRLYTCIRAYEKFIPKMAERADAFIGCKGSKGNMGGGRGGGGILQLVPVMVLKEKGKGQPINKLPCSLKIFN